MASHWALQRDAAGAPVRILTINSNITYPGQFTNNNFSGGMLVNMNDVSTGTCGSYGCGGSAFLSATQRSRSASLAVPAGST